MYKNFVMIKLGTELRMIARIHKTIFWILLIEILFAHYIQHPIYCGLRWTCCLFYFISKTISYAMLATLFFQYVAEKSSMSDIHFWCWEHKIQNNYCVANISFMEWSTRYLFEDKCTNIKTILMPIYLGINT